MANRSKAAVEKKSSKSTSPPIDVMPMLATLVSNPMEKEGWIYEVKWDGYRALGYMKDGSVEIRSRNNKVFTEKYYSITQALRDWKIDAVVDGELVVLLEKGLADFSSMQNWRSEADGHLVYYVFDILWHDGRDLMNEPLHERREHIEPFQFMIAGDKSNSCRRKSRLIWKWRPLAGSSPVVSPVGVTKSVPCYE